MFFNPNLRIFAYTLLLPSSIVIVRKSYTTTMYCRAWTQVRLNRVITCLVLIMIN